MTLRKFAALIGYSPSTVSKAFNGAADVNAETREKILFLAKEQGVYDLFRKEKYDKKMIAVLIPETESRYYTRYVSVIGAILSKKNASMTVSVTSFDKEKENELINYFSSENRSDGIITISGGYPARKYEKVPIVYCGNANDIYADSVNVDFFSGISETIDTFKALRHKKIAFIGDVLTKTKETLFRKAMEYHKIRIDEKLIVKSKTRFEEGGYDCMDKLFAANAAPTALLAAYDYLALGAIKRIEREGLSVPQDISVVGMDNNDLASHDKIGLSSIDSHHEEVCKLLVDRLFEKIERNGLTPIRKTEIKTSLVNRKTIMIAKNSL
ncbi:MAG: LacI family DNA-binding transcriptional regulator [Clostridia bacterium]|nr:LacI family DNA-binding transcriptional regulator [Clostridia bacterium]